MYFDPGFDLLALLAKARIVETLAIIEGTLLKVATRSKLCCIASSIESFGSEVKSSLVVSSSIGLVVCGFAVVGNSGVVMFSFIASI